MKKTKLQPLDCPGKINFNNLIKIKTEAKPTTRNIKIATINVQSLKNKIDLVSEELNDNHINIAILTETWLTDSIEDTTWLKSCELNASPFKILVQNRKGKRGGGIAIVYRNPIKIKLGDGGATRSFKYGTWSVNCNSRTFHIHGIYHPPPGTTNNITNTMFIDDITEYLTSKLQEKSNNIIVGDFNMHIDDLSSNDTIIFNDTMAALGLDQLTHRLGNILDLVYMEISSELQSVICSVGNYVSDHKMVICELKLHKQNIEKKTLCIRKISAVSDEELLSTFDTNIGHCKDLESMVPEFETALKKTFRSDCPRKRNHNNGKT